MNREDIIRMAQEAEVIVGFNDVHPSIERFAALVEAHVNAKEKERQRYDVHSCGPDCDRYICVAVRNEREACAKVCEDEIKRVKPIYSVVAENVLKAIRARGNT